MLTELTAFDFDDTLLHSPRPPSPAHKDWWYHAYSLDDVQNGPGYDRRWMLGNIAAARSSINRPTAMTVVLTARTSHAKMRKQIDRLLGLTGLQFDAVQLKPMMPPLPSPVYKAGAIAAWLNRHPSIQRVTFYDDYDKNLRAVGEVVRRRGLQYVPVLTRPG